MHRQVGRLEYAHTQSEGWNSVRIPLVETALIDCTHRVCRRTRFCSPQSVQALQRSLAEPPFLLPRFHSGSNVVPGMNLIREVATTVTYCVEAL